MVQIPRREEVVFDVTVSFSYVIEPLPDDPDNPFLLADQERHEIYMQILDIPGIEKNSVRVRVDPTQQL